MSIKDLEFYFTRNGMSGIYKILERTITGQQDEIELLQKQLDTVKRPNKVDVENVSGSISQDTKDLIVSGTLTSTSSKVIISGKSVELDGTTSESSQIGITAKNDVAIKNIQTSGTLAKSVSNASISINSDGFVNITDSTIKQNGYNAIEIGLNDTTPKDITIENVRFENELSNNAITIFNQCKDAVITIKNCYFKKVSNVVRISNRDNVPFTINFVNCVCDEWEKGEYSGFLLCQDYTSTTDDQFVASGRFSKVKVNFENCKGVNGDINETNYEIGSKNDKQLVYVYANKKVITDLQHYPSISYK